MDRLSPLELFAAVADTGSFSAAARLLGLAPVQASATIARLERELGARLFERSTRRLRLTEAGEQWLPHARQMLATWEAGQAALRAAAGIDGPLRGRLRVSLPSDLGRQHLWRWIEAFCGTPGASEVQLDVRLSDRLADLVQDPVDHAVRYGEPPDSSLVALPLAPDNRRVLCASPAYLARHGEPRTPADLAGHDCLRFVLGDTIHGRWRFERDGAAVAVDVRGSRVADDGGLVREWALAGLGLTYKSRLDVADDLAAGRLVAVLTAWAGEPAPLHWMVVGRHQLSPALRRLAEFVRARCERLGPGPATA